MQEDYKIPLPDNPADKLLSPSQKRWLEAIIEKQEKGEEINDKVLRVELRNELSKDFDPSKISSYLLRSNTNITLLGIFLIKPESPLVEIANKVIQGVREILIKYPKAEQISAQEISDLIGIKISDVEEVLERLSSFGLFHSGGIKGANGLSAIHLRDQGVLENYLKYDTLEDCLEEVAPSIYYSDAFPENFSKERSRSTPKFDVAKIQPMRNPEDQRNVFVVHGHDNEAKEAVARFLEKLELIPIILHEQPNGGKTIIEKFELYANVGFAVVLLTPDDEGYTKNYQADARPRARQNVIFELGYFFGRLTCGKVCALYKEGVEFPSDFHGILYVPMDGAWRVNLPEKSEKPG